MNSLHCEALAYEKSNHWPWPYALGYAAGIEDARNQRKSQHALTDCDDYALGYHKGFNQSEARQ